MRTKVTEQGVLIPKQLLEGMDEVEIRREQNLILVIPISDGDPILRLGKQPITDDLEDASICHDHYLYNQ